MILISIHPFAFKKLFLLVVVAFLCLSSAACLADSLFMARQYAPDQHRGNHVSSRSGEIGRSARTVALNSDFAESSSFEGVWAGITAQTGMALADTSAGTFSGCSTNDYAIGLRSVSTAEPFVEALAERRIFLF